MITEERKEFAKKCISVYQEYYPEILDEIRGIADGQGTSYEDMYTFLLSMFLLNLIINVRVLQLQTIRILSLEEIVIF